MESQDDLPRAQNNMIFKAQAVIFDMDGVITNTMPFHFEAWRDVLQEQGVDVSFEDIYQREGQPGLQSLRELLADKEIIFEEPVLVDMLTKKETLFKGIVKTQYIDGALEWLKILANQGFRLALVTGTARHELESMLPEDIKNGFEVIVTGDQVKQGKPHPEPYLSALERLNISAQEALVVENAPFGIASAKAAGLTCAALTTSLQKSYLSAADFIYESIAELRLRLNLVLEIS